MHGTIIQLKHCISNVFNTIKKIPYLNYSHKQNEWKLNINKKKLPE